MEGASGEAGVNMILPNYKLGKTVAIDSLGKVRIGEHVLTKHKVAIKIINHCKIKSMGMDGKVQQEIKILRLLSHPNIIHLYEVIETHSHTFMVMEYAQSGELFDYIVEKGRLKEDEAHHFFQQGGIYTLPDHLSTGVRDLITRMLVVDPKKRITIPEICRHPWFHAYPPRYLTTSPPDSLHRLKKLIAPDPVN